MARNGSGVYSLPSGSTISNGDTSDATDLNTPLADIETDLNTARPVVAGGTGAATAADARTNLAVPGKAATETISGDWTFSGTVTPTGTLDASGATVTLPSDIQSTANVLSKAAGYTVVAADRSDLIDCTAALTLALTAAATLGDGFYCWVRGNGGAVTIDPDGAETVNGAATATVPDGASGILFCNGTAWFLVLNPQIGGPALTLDGLTLTEGDVLYVGGSGVTNLGVGTAGQVLSVNSGATAPEWATPIFTASYESGAQTITSGGALVLAHGLGDVPKIIYAYVRCVSAEHNYAVLDRVVATFAVNNTSGTNRVNSMIFDNTNLTIRFSSTASCFVGADANTGAKVDLTNSSWRLYVNAYA